MKVRRFIMITLLFFAQCLAKLAFQIGGGQAVQFFDGLGGEYDPEIVEAFEDEYGTGAANRG